MTLSDASGSLEMPQVVTIAAGQSSTTADVSAKRDGVTSGNHLAVITATAAGHSSGSAYVQVTDIDLPDIVVNNVTVSGNPVAGCPLTVQVKVTNQGYAATNKPVTVKLTLSDGTVLGTVTVADNLAADATATASLEVTLPSVSGSKYITAQVDANNTIAELDALNNSKTSANFNVKAGYSITAAVDKNAVFGEDTVTISGHISTTVEGVSVANRKLYIKVRTVSNGLMANISVTTDENGNFSTTYTPTSSVVGTYSVSAEILGEQTEVLDTFEMGGVSFNFGSYTIWELNVGETRTGSFTVTNTGNVSLTNFRVNADGVPSNISLSLETYDNELEAGETMTVNYTVTGTDLTGGTSYQHITLTANSDEGYAATKDLYTYVQTVKGDLVLDVNSISERVYVKGGVRYFPFTLTNVGAGETGNIKLNINAPEWLTIYSGQEIASLASGESSTVVLAVNPPANFPTEYLNYVYSGNIKVVAENVPVKTVNYDFSFVEETTSKLTVIVSDTLSKNNGDTSIVSTARARLVNVRDSSKTYSANADASGNCIFDDVEAGTYYLYVNADGCAQSKSPVTIPAGADLREAVQLENQTVSVVWDVTRNEYVEVYTTEFTADYVTNVPHVEIGTTGTLTFKNLAWGESDTLAYTVSNYGLVAAGNFVLSLPSWNYCTFEILNNTDSIAPKDEHTFYIKLTYGDGNASHDPGTLLCASDWLRLNWTEYAGGTYQTKYDKVQTEQEICVTTGSGSGGSVPIYVPVVVPYVPIRPVPGGSTSPKAPSSPPVLVQQVASCTPCKASILNAALGYLGQDALTLGTAVTWAEELSTLGVTGDSMMQGISTNVYNTTCAVKVIEGLASCSVVTDTNLTGLMTAGVNLLKGLKSLLSGGIGSVEDLAATLSAFCQTYGLAVTDFSIASVLKAAAVKLEEYRVDVKKKFAEYQGVDVDDEIGTSSALGWLRGSSEVAWSQVSSAIAVLLCTYELSGPFDVSLLLLNDSIDNNLVFDWLRQVGEATSSGSADGHTISASEMETLCRTSALASNYGLSWYLTDLCNRWNATVQNEIGAEGSFSQAYLEALQAAFDQGSAMVKNHYTNAGAMTEAFYTGMEDFLRDTGDEVCATVTMKFSQSMLVSREEFDGTLTIKNSLAGNMTNVFFEVCVLDANGLDVTDQFEIYYYDASGLTGVNFGKTPVSGASLAENTTGSIYVRFTPGMNVAADGPENYSFSGTLSYTDGEGREVEMGLTPVTLEVNPSPNLTLHYFVQQDVYSDNPFTDAIEAPEKAQVGVLVVNNGFGAAKDFTMSNLSVEFTANQQQLPLDFSFVGVSLNGGEMQDLGMSVDFGTIEGNSSAYAVWYFETNLQGTIRLNDDLTITRTDSLGNVSVVIPGDQFSIVSAESTTHTLVRSVVMDETGKTAFLVNDDDDAAKLGDGLYFDDGQYENVNGVTYGTVAGSLGYGNYTVTVTVHLQEGYNHIRLTDPGSGNYVIRSISVAGIGDLYSGCFWQTDREIGADGSYKDNQRLHMLYNSEAEQDVTFTLAFSSVDVTAPQVLSITGVEDHTAVTTVPQIVVIFSEDVDKEYFDASQSVKLDKGGVRVDMAGVDFVWTDDRTLTFDLTGVADGDALYTLTVTNKGVADVFGNVGNGAGSDLQWTMAVQALSVKHVQLLHERQGKEKVGSVSVAFTTAVEKLTVDALQVSRIAGSVTTILEDLSGVTITPLENGSFEISGLEALQDEDGIYLIAVKTSELGAVDSSAELRWTLCRTAPALLSKSTDVAAQSCEQAKQITLQFDHEIASIDADALKLYRGGEIVTNYVLEAQVDAQDATKVVVTISEASAVAFFGAVTREAVQTIDGEWSLNVDLTGVEDIYGNVGAGNASADWVVDTTAPNVVESITLNGSSNTTVSSSTPTLGMTLPEAGLHVEIYVASITDSTLGALVWSGEVSGTEFSHEIRLPYDGRQTLSVILTDAAGNATACTYEVAMDSVALGLTIKAKEKYTQAPESIALVFSAPVNGLTTAALSLTCNGAAVDTAGLTLTQVSDTEWALGGLDSAMLENGAYTVSVDLSQLTKASSGLSGKGTVTAAFTVDSITSVEVVGSNVVSKPGSVEGLSVSFSTAINYAELSASGLLSQAVRLVNQETGEVVLLDAAGFSYADNEITWSGCVTVPAGQYAVVVDAALVTASNGAPLTLGGNAQTALSGFAASASPLGAMGASYTAPYAVDWNGDGLVDLLVGEKTGSEGKLRLYLNNGTAQVPAYSEYTYVQADGTDLSVVASGCQGIVVTLQDINGDGETDLVAGLSDGKVVCYLADGAGSFGAQQQLAALAGSRAFPTFFDRNGDGTADLVIGAGDGSVYYAAATVAGDGSLTFDTLQVIDGIKVSGRAAPVFADVNGDGMADLLVGDANGNLSLYYAVNGAYSLVKTWTLAGVDWERTRPTVADLNGDGKLDIVVGGSTGEVYALYGQENAWSSAPVTVEPLPQLSAVQLAAQGSTLTVTWNVADAPEGAIYKVQISAAGDFSDAVEFTGDASGTLSVEDVEDGTYTARIRIVMPNGVAGEWQSSVGTLVDTTAPEIPADLTAQVDGSAIAFAWGGVQDPSGVHYEIRYSRKADFSQANVREVSGNAFNISGLADGTWYWQVRAVDGKGNASDWVSGESLAVDTAVVSHWAEGVTENVGYYDVNKSGTAADNNLCWAAASSNVLAWWQQAYDTADTTHIEVTRSAQDIYATMQQNWKNVSGCEFNGFVWWLDSEACTDETYLNYAGTNLIGSDGSYYFAYFNGENLATQVVENTLKGVGKSEVAATWADLFAAGAGMTLGVYKNSTVSGTLMGGHAVSLWGFDCSHADNTLTRIYVTDSDDGVDTLVSLDVHYDTTAGLYRVDASGSKLNGYYLGNYTYLAAPAQDLFASVPAAPTGLNIMTPNKKIDFDWNAVSGAATYTLQYALDGDYANAVTLSGLTYDIYELALKVGEVAEGTYMWRVRAVGSNGELSAWAEGSSFLVDLSVEQVSGVKASVSSNALGTTVTLSWNSVTDVSGISHYNVRYSTGADFSNAKTSTAKTFFMKDGYNYYCHVNAQDGRNNIGAWSETVVIINSGTAQAGETGVLLSWLAVENASGYAVRYATDADFAEYETVMAEDASLNLVGLLSGTDYYWRVVALDGDKLMGDWSYADTFTTQVSVYNDTPAGTQSVLVLQEDDTRSVISATVNEYVGADDPEDYFRVRVDQTGTYDLSLDLNALGNPVYLSVGTLSDSDFQVISTVLVSASGGGTEALKNILLQGSTDYYVRVSTVNGTGSGYNGTYTLTMQTEKVADNRITANNTPETATRLALQSDDTAGFDGWIGVGDEVDTYRIELEEDGTLRVNLKNLDYQAKLQVYQVEHGETSGFLNRTVRTNGLDKELSVSAGTYYVQVSTIGAGSSRYNTAYSLDIETEIDGTRKQGVLAAV